MSQLEQINEIHESMLNGQRQQAVKQMQNYSMYDFFADYNTFLEANYTDDKEIKNFILDAANSYFRITNR
jgi:hypothetical protein